MSYSIIFETKIVKLSDGRIIYFDRSGCNNDNAGRRKDDFTAKIYTVDEFIQKAESYKKNSKPYKEAVCMELKIGSRYAQKFLLLCESLNRHSVTQARRKIYDRCRV